MNVLDKLDELISKPYIKLMNLYHNLKAIKKLFKIRKDVFTMLEAISDLEGEEKIGLFEGTFSVTLAGFRKIESPWVITFESRVFNEDRPVLQWHGETLLEAVNKCEPMIYHLIRKRVIKTLYEKYYKEDNQGE